MRPGWRGGHRLWLPGQVWGAGHKRRAGDQAQQQASEPLWDVQAHSLSPSCQAVCQSRKDYTCDGNSEKLCFQHLAQQGHILGQHAVLHHQFGDAADGMHHGGVVTIAEAAADFGQ